MSREDFPEDVLRAMNILKAAQSTSSWDFDEQIGMLARYAVILGAKPKVLPTSNVAPFGGITKLDIDPELVISGAAEKLEGVVVLGYDKDGEEYFASSYADGAEVIWLMERLKKKLLEV